MGSDSPLWCARWLPQVSTKTCLSPGWQMEEGRWGAWESLKRGMSTEQQQQESTPDHQSPHVTWKTWPAMAMQGLTWSLIIR
jgi:hypothetical protein